MSGFAGGGGGGGPGPGGCASYVYQGLVEMATQAETDARTVLGGSGCPLAIGPAVNRLRVTVVGSGVSLLNAAGSIPNPAGYRAVDWQAWRTAITQVAGGLYSTALGQSNTVSRREALAVGYLNNLSSAYAAYSAAIGSRNTVLGANSFIMARNSTIGGAEAVAIGNVCRADLRSVAIGSASGARVDWAVAIGQAATAGVGGGAGGVAVGSGAVATIGPAVTLGLYATTLMANANALGTRAVNRTQRTTVLTAPIMTRRDNGEGLGDADLYFSGANVLIMLPECQISAVADYQISISGGGGPFSTVKFWLEEVGVILTAGVPAAQPTIRFGVFGTLAKYLAPTLCTLLTALRARERFNLLLADDPETDPTFGITIGGTAGCFVRPYFRGHLVEDE
jgi:hypothetical protein